MAGGGEAADRQRRSAERPDQATWLGEVYRALTLAQDRFTDFGCNDRDLAVITAALKRVATVLKP